MKRELVLALCVGGGCMLGLARLNGMAIEQYVVPNVIEDMVLPDTKEIPGYQADKLSFVGCPGEYAQNTFVIRADTDITVLAEPTALKSASGDTIAVQDVDVRIVKCWYQLVSSYWSKRIPAYLYNPMNGPKCVELVPELLLKDPGLVRVDRKDKVNYVKARLKDGRQAEYLKMTPKGFVAPDGTVSIPKKDAILVHDSERLLPVTVPAGENQQFYVTVHIPLDAKPGMYKGLVNLKLGDGGGSAAYIVELRVLPFKLLKPYYISSINYPGAGWHRGERQYRAELENLLAHGVNTPFFSPLGWEDYARALQIRQEMGLSGRELFYFDYRMVERALKSGDFAQLKDEVRKRIEVAREHGFTDVYFYGMDEAGGEDLLKQRKAWEAIHEAGGKMGAAGQINDPWRVHLEAMGDLTNLYRDPRYPSRERAQAWHDKGQKISSYGNPQFGPEQPLAYRRNYGLLLWQNDYDCPMGFLYYIPRFFGDVWNDFDGSVDGGKDYCVVYPAEGGVIDTVQWEGYREGVTDVRYMTTLLARIEEGKMAGGAKAAAALEAEKFVAKLKDGDVNADDTDLDVARFRMIKHILKIVNAK